MQNRYKAILCQEDPYLLELLRYIPLNPVRAKLIQTAEALAGYPWTGHSAILGQVKRPWQAVDEVLSRFGTTVGRARDAYETFVNDAWTLGHRKDLEGGGLINSLGGWAETLLARRNKEEHAFDARILGQGDFAEKILREAEQIDDRRLAAEQGELSLDRLRALAAQALGCDPAALLRHDRRRAVAQARALWIYAATELLQRPSQELAIMLQMSSGSISEARERGRRLAEEHRILSDEQQLPSLK